MLPGEHLVVIGQPEDAARARASGLILRDTLLILLSGPRELFAYLFRQPLEGTVAENVLMHGVGGLNIDGCRVAGQAEVPGSRRIYRRFDDKGDKPELEPPPPPHPGGRWPTNLLLVHGPRCTRVGEKKARATSIHGESIAVRRSGVHAEAGGHQTVGRVQPVRGYADENGTETVVVWECQPDCPVKLLDEQSGDRRSAQGGGNQTGKQGGSAMGFHGLEAQGYKTEVYFDSGGASRFYPQFSTFLEALDWLMRLIGGPGTADPLVSLA
jgi:hypothetical protein